MRLIRFPIFSLLFLLVHITVVAQNATDALRYSYFDYGGTARFVGVGSSLGALGADFSVLSTNPAGLGWYRSSEVAFTPSYLTTKTTSQLTGWFWPEDPATVYEASPDYGPVSETKGAFNIHNFGFVIASQPRRSLHWKALNFGVGLNHLANFNQRFIYEGVTPGSIVERWQEQINNIGEDDFETGPALDAGAIYYSENDGFYVTDYDLTWDQNFLGADVYRRQEVETGGSISELTLSLAGNYEERLLIGMALGVPFINYREDKTYFEEDPNEEVPYFQDLIYTERLRATGAGINFKMGLIYRASQLLRFGFAFHTPTSHSLNESYETSIEYNYLDDNNDFISGFGESPEGVFDYKLNTPWRLMGSAGFVIQQAGFISAEVEWADYSKNKFRYQNAPVEEENANIDIQNTLKSVVNVRIGGEFAFKVFRFRGGFGFLPSPLADDETKNYSFSGGVGVRLNRFFADLGYRYRSQKTGYVPYGTFLQPQQFIDNKTVYNNFMLTVGIRY